MSSQVRRRQGRPHAIDGDILDLVVVNNVGFRICIRELVDMLLRRRAMTSYDTFHVNNLELTGLALSTQDVESSIVQFRLGDPCNIDMTRLLVANRTELRQRYR